MGNDTNEESFSRLRTDLTDRLGCRFPIISAPMAGISDEISIQVSLGGGFGFVGSIHSPSNHSNHQILNSLQSQIDSINSRFTSQLSHTHGVDYHQRGSVLPMGYGAFCWRLEKFYDFESVGEADEGNLFVKSFLRRLIGSFQCIWLSFSDRKLSDWIDLTHRLISENDDRLRGESSDPSESFRRNQIVVQVTNEEEVDELISKGSIEKVDVLVLQGSESGGHGSCNGIPINSFVPVIVDKFSRLKKSKIGTNDDDDDGKLPVIVAAGGLVNGSHLAAMISLGCSGIVCGTRFLATPEAKYSIQQKESILRAKSGDTIRTLLFDKLRGTEGWPPGIDGRGLKNQSIIDHQNGSKIESLRKDYEDSIKAEDSSRSITWCGSSVGSVKEIKSSKEVLNEIIIEAIESIKRSSELLNYKT